MPRSDQVVGLAISAQDRSSPGRPLPAWSGGSWDRLRGGSSHRLRATVSRRIRTDAPSDHSLRRARPVAPDVLPLSTPPGASPRTSARRIETIPLEPDPADTGEGSAAMTASSFSDAFPNSTQGVPSRAAAASACRCARSPSPAASRPSASTTPAARRASMSARACRRLRLPWILARDVERLPRVPASRAGCRGRPDPGLAPAPRLPRPRPRHPAALRAAGRDHPRDGVRRAPRGAAPSSCGARWPAAAPSSRPTSTTPSSSR